MKLCLNNLWGKFGQRDHLKKVLDTFNELDFAAITQNDIYDVYDIIIHDCSARTISYNQKKEFVDFANNTNVAIAAFTTSYARLRLYEALSVLQHDVLYCDTDSVIFVRKKNAPCPLITGYTLGDLSNELKPGDYIKKFVSGGPKSYAYITKDGIEEMKMKGFSLNQGTKSTLNFDKLYDVVVGKIQSIPIEPFSLQIMQDHTIKKRKWQNGGKHYGFTFNKRKIMDGNSTSQDTVPFKNHN